MDTCREAVTPYDVLPLKETYTYDDYVRLPEGAPYQLLGGKLVMTPAPSTKHQTVVQNIFLLLSGFLGSAEKGKIFLAPVDVFFSPTDICQPDVLYILPNRLSIIAEDKVNGAPDLIVEVLSPSTAYYDLRKKYKLYEQYGVREYWIADPMENSLEVYELRNGRFVLADRQEGTGEIASRLLPDFSVRLADVF